MNGTGNHFSVGDNAFASVERADGSVVAPDNIVIDLSALSIAGLGVGGHFIVECYDPEGNLKWEDVAENAVTNAGIASLLNVYFNSATQITTWYIGLVDNAAFTAFAAGDTSASHAGWSEVDGANVSDSVRVTWGSGSASGGAVTNASTSDYHMTPSGSLTVKGLFLISVSTKGGTTGVLFSTAAFTGGTQAVNSGDTLKITYTVSATSS